MKDVKALKVIDRQYFDMLCEGFTDIERIELNAVLEDIDRALANYIRVQAMARNDNQFKPSAAKKTILRLLESRPTVEEVPGEIDRLARQRGYAFYGSLEWEILDVAHYLYEEEYGRGVKDREKYAEIIRKIKVPAMRSSDDLISQLVFYWSKITGKNITYGDDPLTGEPSSNAMNFLRNCLSIVDKQGLLGRNLRRIIEAKRNTKKMFDLYDSVYADHYRPREKRMAPYALTSTEFPKKT